MTIKELPAFFRNVKRLWRGLPPVFDYEAGTFMGAPITIAENPFDKPGEWNVGVKFDLPEKPQKRQIGFVKEQLKNEA